MAITVVHATGVASITRHLRVARQGEVRGVIREREQRPREEVVLRAEDEHVITRHFIWTNIQ